MRRPPSHYKMSPALPRELARTHATAGRQNDSEKESDPMNRAACPPSQPSNSSNSSANPSGIEITVRQSRQKKLGRFELLSIL